MNRDIQDERLTQRLIIVADSSLYPTARGELLHPIFRVRVTRGWRDVDGDRTEMPRVTHVLFDMDDVLAVRSTEATCASLAASSGLSAQQVMERL